MVMTHKARQVTHNFEPNNGRRALVGEVEWCQGLLKGQVWGLAEANAGLQLWNSDIQATMEATTEVMLHLLAEPRGEASPVAPAASGITRTEFATYRAKSEYDLSVLVQTLKGRGATKSASWPSRPSKTPTTGDRRTPTQICNCTRTSWGSCSCSRCRG